MVLLFDDGKRLEKAVGEEAAQVIVSILERLGEEQKQEAVTKGDLRETELRLQKEIEMVRKEIEVVRGEIQQTRAETIKWVVGMMIAQFAALAALIKF